MKKCPFCGKEIPEEMQFCPYCMERFMPAEKIEPQPLKKYKKPIYIASAIAAITLIAGTVIFFAVRQQNKKIGVLYDSAMSSSQSGADKEKESSDVSKGVMSSKINGIDNKAVLNGDNEPVVNGSGSEELRYTQNESNAEEKPPKNTNTDNTNTENAKTNSESKNSSDNQVVSSSSAPSTTTSMWNTQNVSGGVEVTGIAQNISSGSYIIPSAIDGKTVVGIGYAAFKNDNTIKNVTIPDTVRYIRENAFVNCNYLSDVYIRSAEIDIATYAFSSTYQRNVNLTIHAPASVMDSMTARIMWDALYEEWDE